MIRDITEILKRHFDEAYKFEQKCQEEDIFMFVSSYDIVAQPPMRKQLRNCAMEIIGRIKGIDAKQLHREPTYDEAFDWCRRNFPCEFDSDFFEYGALSLIEWIKEL